MAFRVLEEIPGTELSPRPEDAVDPRPRALANNPLPGGGPTQLTQPSTGFRLLGEANAGAPWAPESTTAPQGPLGPPSPNRDRIGLGFTGPFGLPRIPPAPLSLAVPPAAGILGRLGLQAAVGAGEGALRGAKQGTEGAVSGAVTGGLTGAAGAAVGEGLSRAGQFALSAIPFRALQERTGAGLSDWLTRNIPSWKGLGTGPKALWEMAHGSGQARLDEAFRAAKQMIPPALVTDVSEDVAKRLGAKGTSVAVRELVDALPKMRGPLHRDAWAAIDTALDKVPQPLLQAARNQYRLGMGWIEFANKGKFLSDTAKGFDLLKAQKALSQYGRKSLLGRGMEATFRAIQGQGAITPQKIGIPTGVKVGPMPVNIPLGTAYRGVPQGPLGQAVQSILGRLGAVAPAAVRPTEEED